MSDKFFFKGKKEKKPKHSSYGFNTKRALKAGSKDAPFQLVVTTEERKLEVEALVAEHKIFADIEVNVDGQEDIVALSGFLSKPKTTTFDKKPNRNDPCSCGSGKKYKKCCA